MAKREGRVSRKGLRWPKVTRDSLIFMTGLVLTIHEGLSRNAPERPYLFALYAGMMGLPVFLNQDEKRKKDDSSSESPGNGNGNSIVTSILQKLPLTPPILKPLPKPQVPDSQEPPTEDTPPQEGFT